MSPFEMEIFLRQLYGLRAGRMMVAPGEDPAGLAKVEAFPKAQLPDLAAMAGYGMCILKRALLEDMGSDAFFFIKVADALSRKMQMATSFEAVAEVLGQARDHVFLPVYKVERGMILRR